MKQNKLISSTTSSKCKICGKSLGSSYGCCSKECYEKYFNRSKMKKPYFNRSQREAIYLKTTYGHLLLLNLEVKKLCRVIKQYYLIIHIKF